MEEGLIWRTYMSVDNQASRIFQCKKPCSYDPKSLL